MENVEAYISKFPATTQSILNKIREMILAEPDVVENIAYDMPAYKTFGRPLVYFAAYKNHIGFYATPTGHEAFKDALSKYKQGKGSVQFPLDEPIPYALIKKIIKFRIQENKLHENNHSKKGRR